MNNFKFKMVLITLLSSFYCIGQKPIEESKFAKVVTDYLETNIQNYNYKAEDIQSLYITNEFYSKGSGINYLYLNQAYNGILIYNAVSTIAIKDDKVIHFSNRFLSNIFQKALTSNTNITAISAINKVASELGIGQVSDLIILEDTTHKKLFSTGNISVREIPVKKVYYNDNGLLRLSWDITIYTLDGIHWWNVRIDANTSDILDIKDYILNCSFEKGTNSENSSHSDYDHLNGKENNLFFGDGAAYNVFTLPIESPNHGEREIVSNPASTVASPFGWHDTNGSNGPEFTITRGNNVWAQEDSDGNNGIGFSPDGTAALNFNFPLEIDQEPSAYQSAAITNLFYINNMMHDIWYHHGFDEESGNFQENNYGNGGLGSDFVFADAQDGSGLNNATFGTPPEGNNPVMTMFLWSGPPGERLIINNSSVAGNYIGVEAQFGPELTTNPITADLVIVEDAAVDGDSADACDSIVNATEISGNIAVINRGSCEFGFKVLSAENAGAIAVIVINNVGGEPFSMAPGSDGENVSIPSIMISQADGEDIVRAIEKGGQNVSASLVNDGTGPFEIDSDFDNGIIAHEYGHGISTRLTGGSNNSGCLQNDEQMGEGWSDWFGLMVTMNAFDISTEGRGIGTYSANQNSDGPGIRPARYSTDFAVNPFTYADTNNESLSQPHGVGFVWATTLWDLTWAYIDKYGFDSDLYEGNGGNNKVMKIVIEALKLQPCSPGFVDGRDAILAADMIMTGGEDQCMIWEIFSNRGLGFNADQGLSSSRTDQTQDFSMPPPDDASLVNCTTLSDVGFESTFANIYPNPTNGIVYIKLKEPLNNVTLTLVDLNGREIFKSKQDMGVNTEISLQSLQDGVYILKIESGTIEFNTKIVKH
ncbi:T9SS-dependent M36 family metallopeptidase [Winogradskyella sp. A3E31]|uniref:T9SS-dependent M36 family metallopeptidase n=1 Tax=Winogradskyella sp. A3E31 TaxID=3349637 RepID=UPI00398AB78B